MRPLWRGVALHHPSAVNLADASGVADAGIDRNGLGLPLGVVKPGG
jgi:hypothetical protein